MIPAYRESIRLPEFLKTLGSAIQKTLPEIRILVVDDGSGGKEQSLTTELVNITRQSLECVLPPLLLAENMGKGGAILAGWDTAEGYDYLGFVDADGAVPVEEVIRVARLLPKRVDQPRSPALFASRVRMRGKTIRRSTSRHLIGRVFASMVGILIDPDVYDSQCGLKFLPASAFKTIRHCLKGRRFAFDVELLAVLNLIKHPILEVPIDWADMPGSKVSMISDTLKMAKAVFEIRNEAFSGKKLLKTNGF